MKRLLCFFACIALLTSSALAGAAPQRLTEDDPAYAWMTEKSLALAGLFDQALRSDGYLSLYFKPDQFEALISTLRMQDFTKPTDITVIRSDHLLSGNKEALIEDEIDAAALPRELADHLRRSLYRQAALSLVGQEGNETVALFSVLAVSDGYPQPDSMTGPGFTVLWYGGLYVLLVTFVPNGNGVVGAVAQFLPSRQADSLAID